MKVTTPLLLLGLLLTVPAHAAVNANSCKADAEKYCPGVKPGGGAIEACLGKHEKSLSPDCAQARQEMKHKAMEFSKACVNDVQTNCSDVKAGGGRVLKCLKQNEAKLSAECKSAMQPLAK